MSWNTNPADQAADRTDATDSPSRSRRDLLKVGGSAGAASLGMVSLADTAAASESGEEELGASGPDESTAPTTGAPIETESVEIAGNLRTGPKAITVAHPSSGTVAILHIDDLGWWYVYNNSWEYANYINDNTAIGNCETPYWQAFRSLVAGVPVRSALSLAIVLFVAAAGIGLVTALGIPSG